MRLLLEIDDFRVANNAAPVTVRDATNDDQKRYVLRLAKTVSCLKTNDAAKAERSAGSRAEVPNVLRDGTSPGFTRLLIKVILSRWARLRL